jgi:2-dehydro-3-deoxyphosphooctonate aldolase (KDO 8-P synthase)
MIKVGNIQIGGKAPLVFILGPCVMESESLVLECAERLQEICPYPFIFKSSFDKANRSSIHSFRGPGLEKGLSLLQKVKDQFHLPVTTDIHTPEQASPSAEVIDLIQIPAFLCRQTDLILESAKTGKPLNVKKGQFVAPHDMNQVVFKVKEAENPNLMLTERGFSFGYNNLVCDMRGIPIMKNFGVPVCFDASHSVQLPGGLGNVSSGDRHFIPTLAKSAIAAGADAIFIETHPDPDKAKSDSKSQWPLDKLRPLLDLLYNLHQFVGQNEAVL